MSKVNKTKVNRVLFGDLEFKIEQIPNEKPSLLMLDDYCVFDIFKFLQLKDYISLAETCSRLCESVSAD